jgi:hypothetical protein
MFLLSLIAALAGTPLRQAEAASDFARKLGDIERSPGIEMIDGGVGDDSGATILKSGRATTSPWAATLRLAAHAVLPLRLSVPSLPAVHDQTWREPTAVGWASSARRCALLQQFLF